MKSFTIAAIAISATLASAQLSALPPCAITCATGSLGSTGCGLTDIACVCKATSFISGLTSCVEKSCTPAEVAQAGQAAVNLCQSAGVTITLPGQSSAAPAPAPTTAAPAPVMPSSAPAPVAPSSSAAAPVYTSSAPAVVSPPVYYTSSSSSAAPTTLTTSCSTTSSVASTTVVSLTKTSTIHLPSSTGSSNSTGNSTAPSTPSMPAVYTGAASLNTVGGISALLVAMVAGLML